MMKDILYKNGIIPVISIDDENNASELAQALLEGGLNCIEVTFRTDRAKQAIEVISTTYPEMYIIAGTVLSCSQADEAMEAGAKAIVAPGLNEEVARYCIEKGYPYIPGVCTPSEIEKAMSLGFDTLKFFPAELSGGLKMLEAFNGPYANIKFMPTGGINIDNAKSYLEKDFILCVGGTWIASRQMINEKKFDVIKEYALQASNLVKELR